MNKNLPLISLFIMSIVSILYWTLIPKEGLYEAKWNAPDTTIAITIDGEISTTFPTTSMYVTSVECNSGTGKVEWNGIKWVLTTSGITKGNTKCNITFIPTLTATILANNDVKTPLTTPGTATSTENETLLVSAEDDYGTSYYFRGAVKNNYVEFANKCWRIVRINGDNSVKLILHNDNASNVSSPCALSNNSTTAAFARYSGSTYSTVFNSSDDESYVGFMYGGFGGMNSYSNIRKSAVLINLETWYTNNLASYENKLADTIWCNDKNIAYNDSRETIYGGFSRLSLERSTALPTMSGPSLVCPNHSDGEKLSKFTVNDTTNGNGTLTYKIGLLTADEIVLSGYIFPNNTENTYDISYLQENTGTTSWWTLSPSHYYSGEYGNYAYVFCINGYSGGGCVTNEAIGLRPAISLVSSTTISGGTGTSEDPYIVN